ncbi:MAG: carbohydrate ABC transporter permease [Ruminococcaceae bacterium]|nr:carbohydrate ABC transporter permease [Oscillospiraceae bacterium]
MANLKGNRVSQIVIHIFFALFSLLYVLPLLLVISISFSCEKSVTSTTIVNAGYHLIPTEFSLEAYDMALRSPEQMLQAYFITAAQAVIGTLGSCLVLGMVAYPLSRSAFSFRKPVTFIVFFTMLFGGGLIPTYIVYTNIFGLGNNFLVYILPGLAGGAWYTLVIRTFFKNLPESLFESAKIDGAREITIFLRIAMPLSTPAFATVGFLMLVTKWNDWNTSLIYIRDARLYTLQYLLQRILNEAKFLMDLAASGKASQITAVQTMRLPMETLRYAMCVLAAGPMLIIFPLFQKYFASVLTVGAIKG